MDDNQVHAELERIDKERGTGFALVYKAACDFVNGILLKGIDTPGDRLLNVDRSGSPAYYCHLIETLNEIARTAWKGGKS